MYVPRDYREPDASWMADLIRRNPMALMTLNGADGEAPFATHLPVIPDPSMADGWPEGLVGGRLIGHMNRANPHWKALIDGAPVKLVFSGPHAYVSPTVYAVTPAAPTWDFTAVHLCGRLTRLDSMEETLHVVESTVRNFEGDFGQGWDMTESLGYFRKIAPGVGAFLVEVTKADGMFKLSQEQPDEVRGRVLADFSGRGCTRHQAAAELMRRLPCPVHAAG